MPAGGALTVRTHSANETEAFGRALGLKLRAGDVLALSGDLGAGKTVMVRGIAAGAGSTARVVSPTFTLIREYAGPLPLFHADLYRINGPEQVADLGLEELFEREAIVVIEWADHAREVLPPEHLWISIAFGPEPDERELSLIARGTRYAALLAELSPLGATGGGG